MRIVIEIDEKSQPAAAPGVAVRSAVQGGAAEAAPEAADPELLARAAGMNALNAGPAPKASAVPQAGAAAAAEHAAHDDSARPGAAAAPPAGSCTDAGAARLD
jgi:hypothetical protein